MNMADIILRSSFMLEILLAELVFLYPAEKRSYFPLRYFFAVIAAVLFSLLVPFSYSTILGQFVLFASSFAVTVVLMGLCFRLSPAALVSVCVSGYALEHIAFHISKLARAFGFMSGMKTSILDERLVSEFVLFPVIYLIAFLTVGLYAAKRQAYKRIDTRFNRLSVVTILICIGLTRVAAYFGDAESVTVSLYAIVACLMALMIQLVLSKTVELEHENETISLLWQEDRKQYELSKKTMDIINIKYHDLKHTLRDMKLPEEEVKSIKDAVRVYGSRIKTGNEALDVLLTENTLRCSDEGIVLTYTGQGTDFSFMNTADVYSLFGNAISNAVEAVQKLEDPEKKVIDILSERRGELISIHVSNFFNGELEISDGLPVTSKKEEEGFHGYGMKSMKLIAEKYGGSLSTSVEGELFHLNVYLMEQ